MKDLFSVFILCLLISTGPLVASSLDFIASVPGKLRAGWDNSVHVLLIESIKDSTLSLALESSSGSVVASSETKNVKSGDSSLNITLSIDESVMEGDYVLFVLSDDARVSNGTVSVVSHTVAVFIETDKPLYQPGQEVLIRLLALTPELKPSPESIITVEIYDPKGFKISRWPDIALNDVASWSESLVLAMEPTMGVYRISASLGAFLKEIQFTVDRFVLPRFEVVITPSVPFLVSYDKELIGTVKAQYTYGKPVQGTLTVRALLPTRSIMYDFMPIDEGKSIGSGGESEYEIIFSVVISNFDGSAPISIPLGSVDFYRSSLVIEATVYEQSTRIRQNSTISIPVSVHSYKIKMTPDRDLFFPGVPLRVFVTAINPAGISSDVSFTVEVSGRCGSYEQCFLEVIHVDVVGGETIFEVIPPVDVTNLNGRIMENSLCGDFSSMRSSSPTGNYLSLETEQKTLSVGRTFSANLIMTRLEGSTESLNNVVSFVVMSTGRMHTSGVVVMEGGKGELSFVVTMYMQPIARILITTTVDGEVLADSYSLSVRQKFGNPINTDYSMSSVAPGGVVNITAEAHADSVVYFLAVDKSIELLGGSSSLSADSVFSEILDTFDSGTSGSSTPRPWYFFNQRGIEDHIRASGMVIITSPNLNVPSYSSENDHDMFQEDGILRGVMPVNMADDGAVTEKTSATTQLTQTRRFFPESWVHTSIVADHSGSANLMSQKVPDTITSWVLSSFAIHRDHGLGVGMPVSLYVFKDFFVTPNMPTSAVRGEVVPVIVGIYNYGAANLDVTVSIDISLGDFTVVGGISSLIVHVSSGEVASVTFKVNPKVVGPMPVVVSGRSVGILGDTVHRTLHVIAEGVEHDFIRSVFIRLDESNPTFAFTMDGTLPRDVIDGSARAEVQAVGDILEPSIDGLDRLLKFPYGCGEQNLVNFVPSVFVSSYFTAVGRPLSKKAYRIMTTGYQQELTYMHKDGSFSAFGESDPEGSIWLTAYVLKSFAQASKHVYIDDGIMTKAAHWIAKHQNKDGSFPSVGRVIHTDMMSGVSSIASLSAFILIALLEAKLETGVSAKALSYLEELLDTGFSDDVYALTLTTYALSMAKSSKTPHAINLLSKHANVNDDGSVFYSNSPDRGTPKMSSCYYCDEIPSTDVELSAYVLLTILNNDDLGAVYPIVKYLLSKRNSFGGYHSTQDTVVALQALTAFAIASRSSMNSVSLSLTSDNMEAKMLTVDTSNFDLLQAFPVPSGDDIHVSASGNGNALVLLTGSYNTPADIVVPFYHIKTSWTHTDSNQATSSVRVCAREIESNARRRSTKVSLGSGMVLVTLKLFSGYIADEESLKNAIKSNPSIVKRFENNDNDVVFYIESLNSDKDTCVEFSVNRVFFIDSLQPARVEVMSYYQPNERSSAFVASHEIQAYSSRSSSSVSCINSLVIAIVLFIAFFV